MQRSNTRDRRLTRCGRFGSFVDLQPQKEEQVPVTVYATCSDTRLQDSPVHVEVVSQDEINEEIAMRPRDISMLLDEMGGMRMQTTSPALGAASVTLLKFLD